MNDAYWRIRRLGQGPVRGWASYAWWADADNGWMDERRHACVLTERDAARELARALRRLEAVEAKLEHREPRNIVVTRGGVE